MSGMLVISIGFILLFVLVIIFFYLKDAESQKRLARYEKSIDELNKEVYRVQKSLKNGAPYNDGENLRDDMKASLDDVYALIEKDREYVDNKLAIMEERIKEQGIPLASSNSNVDDKRIITMFKDGWSIEAIARELMITKSEVEFTLKLANIN